MVRSKDDLVLLTLNTHSWQEADNASCLSYAAEALKAEAPDIVALQEVNQTIHGAAASDERLSSSGFISAGDAVSDNNWALRLAEMAGGYHWTWAFAHIGYSIWAEGIAILSKKPVLDVRVEDLSAPGANLRRNALAVRTENGWFCSSHLGWWGDERDPFIGQWKRLNAFMQSLDGARWLMGDFNAPAHIRGEGYDCILRDGWQDCFVRAKDRDSGATVPHQIDGWRNQQVDGFRMDLCLAGQSGQTLASHVIFNGSNYPVISDHFGVLTKERDVRG